MPATILESFGVEFSGTSVASTAGSSAHVSGQTTLNCEPPGYALEIPVQTYTAIADTVLNRYAPSLSSKYLAEWETGIIIQSEGDVVATSATYLNNPVQLALEATAANTYAHRSEVTQGYRTRADKIYYRRHTSFAVLDYKSPGVLVRSEFQDSIVRNYDDYAAWQTGDEPTRNFDDDELRFARPLMKQSVHYSSAYRTPFVALFDWNTLILLVLHRREGDRGGEYCYMTVVDDRRRFRKALLGFLLVAGRNEDLDSKLRLIKPSKEVDFQSRWTMGEQNPSLYEKRDRPSRSGAKKPEGSYNQSFSSTSEYNDSIQRGRRKGSDKYYPPTASAHPANVSNSDLFMGIQPYYLTYRHPVRRLDQCLPGQS